MVIKLVGQLAHGAQHFAREFGVEREVGSSNSMMSGSIASARAMATRCFWPPDSRPG